MVRAPCSVSRVAIAAYRRAEELQLLTETAAAAADQQMQAQAQASDGFNRRSWPCDSRTEVSLQVESFSGLPEPLQFEAFAQCQAGTMQQNPAVCRGDIQRLTRFSSFGISMTSRIMNTRAVRAGRRCTHSSSAARSGGFRGRRRVAPICRKIPPMSVPGKQRIDRIGLCGVVAATQGCSRLLRRR